MGILILIMHSSNFLSIYYWKKCEYDVDCWNVVWCVVVDAVIDENVKKE